MEYLLILNYSYQYHPFLIRKTHFLILIKIDYFVFYCFCNLDEEIFNYLADEYFILEHKF